jgi:hypothetical protein
MRSRESMDNLYNDMILLKDIKFIKNISFYIYS